MNDPAAPRAYRAIRPGTRMSKATVYADERCCVECSSALSRYNPGPFCSSHDRYNPLRFPRLRGEQPDPA